MDEIKTLTQEKATYIFLAEGLTQDHQQSVKLDLLRKADSIQAKINELECAMAKALIENSGLNIDGVIKAEGDSVCVHCNQYRKIPSYRCCPYCSRELKPQTDL